MLSGPAEVREYSPKNQLPLPAGRPVRRTGPRDREAPRGCRLFAEGKALSLTVRTHIRLAELPVGREYTYTFKIEYDRNGRTLTEQQNIKVTRQSERNGVRGPAHEERRGDSAESGARADAETAAGGRDDQAAVSTPTSLVKPDAAAGQRANIQVKLPVGATLFVNDAKQSKTEFTTRRCRRARNSTTR